MSKLVVLLFLLLSIVLLSGCIGVVDVVELDDQGKVTKQWKAKAAFTVDGLGAGYSFYEPKTRDVIYKF